MSVSLAPRALIEEDDRTNQHLLQLVLRRAGFHTDVAVDTDTAIAALSGERYDLVVVDYGGLGVRALATAWVIGRLTNQRPRRIVAVAPSSSPAERAFCREAGVDDLVTDPRELDNIARSVIGPVEAGSVGPLDLDPDSVLGANLIVDLADQPLGQRRELVTMIDVRTSELLVQTNRELRRGRSVAATVAAHRLEGIASILRAGRLSRHCIALQAAIRSEQLVDARVLAESLSGEQVALVNELREQVLDDPGPEQPSGATSGGC